MNIQYSIWTNYAVIARKCMLLEFGAFSVDVCFSSFPEKKTQPYLLGKSREKK